MADAGRPSQGPALGSGPLPHAPAFLLSSPQVRGRRYPPPHRPRCGRSGARDKPCPLCHQPVTRPMASPGLGLLLALGLPLLLTRWGRVWGQSRYRSGALGVRA